MHPSPGELKAYEKRPFKNVTFATPPPKRPPPPKPHIGKKPAERPRTKLAPPEHEFDTSASTKFASLVREAEGLSILRYPLAGAFLLRTIVELAVNRYVRSEGLPPGNKLAGRAEAAAKHMVGAGLLDKSELRVFRLRFLSPQSPCSIQSLNGFVHQERALPTADDLRPAWEAAVPLLIAVYGRLV